MTLPRRWRDDLRLADPTFLRDDLQRPRNREAVQGLGEDVRALGSALLAIGWGFLTVYDTYHHDLFLGIAWLLMFGMECSILTMRLRDYGDGLR